MAGMTHLPLLLTTLCAMVSSTLAQCPSVRAECVCSYKDSVLDVMSCTHLGQHEQVPEFFNGSEVLLQNLEIGQSPGDVTTIRTLQDGAFDGLQLRTLTLTNITIETVQEDALSDLGPYLESLYIDQNMIAQLPVYVFRDLTELIYLHLESNQLSAVNRTYFQTLTKLQHLHLHDNGFTMFPLDTFNDLINLDRLYLDFNQLTNIPDSIFDTLVNLKILNLQSNNISQISENVLLQLEFLERLEIQRNQITDIAPNLFQNNRQLLHFDASFNRLRAVPSSLFGGSLLVEYIDLGFNNIRELVGSTFRSMRQLEYLFLRDNQLTSIPKNIFENLLKLLVLDLQNNQLDSLQIDYFRGLSKLKELTLQHNRISTIEYGVFDVLADLQLLDLSSNDITAFSESPFLTCRKLESLRLYDNKIVSITSDLFDNLENLQYLYLQQNNIRSAMNDSFLYLQELSYLDLSDNWLTDLSQSVFTPLVKLQTLKLSRNPLLSLEAVLSGLSNLRELHLNNSCFEQIPVAMVADLPQIETIFLRHNNLKNVTMDTFLSSTLTTLDLAYCNLEFIEAGSLGNSLTYLDLTGNNLECDCRNTWLRAHVGKLHNPDHLVCNSPQDMIGYFTACYPQTSCIGAEWDTVGQALCMDTPMVTAIEPGAILDRHSDDVYVDPRVCDLSRYPGLLETTPGPTPIPSNILTNLSTSRSDSYFVFTWNVASQFINQIEKYTVEFEFQSNIEEFDTQTNSLSVHTSDLPSAQYAVCISITVNSRIYNELLCGEFIRALFTTTATTAATAQEDDTQNNDVTSATPKPLTSEDDKEGFSLTLTIIVAAAGGVLTIAVIISIVCCVLRKSKPKEKDTLPAPYTAFNAGSLDFKSRHELLVEQSTVSFPGSDDSLSYNHSMEHT